MSSKLDAFFNDDWVSCVDDRHSTIDYCFYLGDNLMAWSSTKAEYYALAQATIDIMWIQYLFNELGISLSNTPIIWCDN